MNFHTLHVQNMSFQTRAARHLTFLQFQRRKPFLCSILHVHEHVTIFNNYVPSHWLQPHGHLVFAKRDGPISARWDSYPVNLWATAKPVRWPCIVMLANEATRLLLEKGDHNRTITVHSGFHELRQALFWRHHICLPKPLTLNFQTTGPVGHS